MTPSELEQHLTIIRIFIKNERNMRRRVFANRPAELAQKLTEIDAAIYAITEIANALKSHMPQPTPLIDA